MSNALASSLRLSALPSESKDSSTHIVGGERLQCPDVVHVVSVSAAAESMGVSEKVFSSVTRRLSTLTVLEDRRTWYSLVNHLVQSSPCKALSLH